MKNARPVSKGQVFLHQIEYVLLLPKQKPDWTDSYIKEVKLTNEVYKEKCFMDDAAISKPGLHCDRKRDKTRKQNQKI